jgi:hypothetical protein
LNVKVIQSSYPGPDCLTSELIREADQDISLGHFPGKYGGKYRGLRTGFAHPHRVHAARDEAEVGRRELPLARMPLGLAARLELLEVRELADVDLRGQVLADRVLERSPRSR